MGKTPRNPIGGCSARGGEQNWVKNVKGDKHPVLKLANTGIELTCGLVTFSSAAILYISKLLRVDLKSPDQEDKHFCNCGAIS